MKVLYIAVCFLLGIMIGNMIYTNKHREIRPEECISVCVEAYSEEIDYE